LTPLIVRKIPAGTFGVKGRDYRVYMKLGPSWEPVQNSFRLYREDGASMAHVFGGTYELFNEIDITNFVSETADSKFFIEGLYFAGMMGTGPYVYDGLIAWWGYLTEGKLELVFEVRSRGIEGASVPVSPSADPVFGRVQARDTVKLKVAPFIMLPNTQGNSGGGTWAVERHGVNGNLEFLGGLTDRKTVPVYDNWAEGTPNHSTDPDGAYTRWFQDHVEVGYTQRPGGPKQSLALRLPYRRGEHPAFYVHIPEWIRKRMIGPDVGMFTLGMPGNDAFERWEGQYGGNLELIPQANGLGKILVGDTMRSDGGDYDIVSYFLQMQRVQALSRPTEDDYGSLTVIPTRWLMVGHVDEVVNFSPIQGKAVIASPKVAFDELEARVAPANRMKTPMFSKGSIAIEGTVEEIFSMAGGPTTGGQNWHRLRVTLVGATPTPGDYWIRIHSGPGAGQTAKVQLFTAQDDNGIVRNYLEVYASYRTGPSYVSSMPGANGMRNFEPIYNLMGSSTLLQAYVRKYQFLEPPLRAIDASTLEKGRFVLVQDTEWWYGPDSTGFGLPALHTLGELLNDTALRTQNMAIQSTIDQRIKPVVAGAVAGTTFVELPQIYIGQGSGMPTQAFALTPSVVNFQVMGDRMFIPKPLGPMQNGSSLLQSIVQQRLASSGITAYNWVDTWKSYHRAIGNAHCATASHRPPFNFDWYMKEMP